MKVVSLFSGIGGFDEGFRRAGFSISAACEINADCRKVLRRHFPETEIYNDVKAIKRETFAGGSIDVLAGGFPCQDLSVAGKREGLAGERSGLWFEFLRIITDHRPGWVVIENVPGLLSSNGGRDFAVILQGLVQCGYGVTWRVLDAQHFGLAQRRERVFIVGSLRSGRAAEVLFEREGGGWNPAPRREAGQRVAATITAGTSSDSGVNAPGRRREDDVNLIGFGLNGHNAYSEHHATLRSKGGDCGGGSEHLLAYGGNNTSGPIEIATACNAHGGTGRNDFESETFIAHTLRGEGFDASEDGTGRGTPLIAYPIQEVGKRTGVSTDDARCGIGIGAEDDPMYTLQSGAQHGICAFTERTRAEGRTVETQEELAYSLTDASKGGNPHSGKIAGGFGVRRLMPIECERLQGFPEVENSAIIEVCLDLLKNLANAENRNHKSQKPVGSVERTELNQHAMSAEISLSPNDLNSSRLAQSDVLIYCAERGVGILNQEKSQWHASNAAKASWFLPSINPDDFVQANVLINTIAGQITNSGEAGSHQSGRCLIRQKNGEPFVRLFGSAITQRVSDASEGSTTQSRPMKPTISSPSNTQSLEQQLITLCCSVVSAISGFIPKRTQNAGFLRIKVVTRFGWTALGDDGKAISDSARYRMLGNAVAVPVAEWIARRIAACE